MDRRERLNDEEESLRMAMEGHQAKVWTALPAIVVSVNLQSQTISAQPSIQGSVSDASGQVQFVNLPLLVDVPICFPKAGGFALTFPIASGDEVLIVFASRCIDSWWQSGGIQAPAEVRMHDLSDGFALLAPTSQPKRLSVVSSSNVQLRNNEGDTFLEITPSGSVKITATSSVEIAAPTFSVAAETINLTADTLNITAEVNIDGTINQENGDFVIGGITFAGHKHTGVVAGGDESGGPTN